MIKVALIGAGRMASAMVRGMLKNGAYEAEEIGCICGDDSSGPELAKSTRIRYIDEEEKLFNHGQLVILACKPQQLAELDERIAEWTRDSLVLSILAGTRLERLQESFPHARNIVRAMPNTPGQIGAGVTAFSPLSELAQNDLLFVESVLISLGIFMEVPETQLDAVTAVSGSGPAYVFEFTIALRKAAVAAGLPENVAAVLVRETVFGAAKLMEDSWMKPEELRDSVTSPGGTTEAALQVMEKSKGNLNSLLVEAVEAARKRSIELSEL